MPESVIHKLLPSSVSTCKLNVSCDYMYMYYNVIHIIIRAPPPPPACFKIIIFINTNINKLCY